MNTNLIKKCLIELDKETPNLSYLKGILESIVELSGTNVGQSSYAQNSTEGIPFGNCLADATGSGLDTSIPNNYVTSTGPVGKLE